MEVKHSQLVEAAPYLLEALENLVRRFYVDHRWHKMRGGDDYPDNADIALARDAISKATGEK